MGGKSLFDNYHKHKTTICSNSPQKLIFLWYRNVNQMRRSFTISQFYIVQNEYSTEASFLLFQPAAFEQHMTPFKQSWWKVRRGHAQAGGSGSPRGSRRTGRQQLRRQCTSGWQPPPPSHTQQLGSGEASPFSALISLLCKLLQTFKLS